MKTGYRETVLPSFKARVVLVGVVVLMYGDTIESQAYFNPILSTEDQIAAVKREPDRNSVNDEGLTGLMFAAIYGQLNLAKALFEYGADLNLQSPKEQQTALHYSTNNMRSLVSQNVGYFLVDAYANTMIKNIFGQIPLHLVISTDVNEDRTRMVEYLVKNGSNINAQTDQGDTLLHLAVNINNNEWTATLLSQWASLIDLTIKNKKGLTPYEYAQELGLGDMAAIVQKKYPKVTTATGRSSNGLTGLMLAIMRNDQETIAKMARNSTALNMLSNDRYKNSALHIGILYQNDAAVSALVRNKANLLIRNARREVPAHFLVRVWDADTKLKITPLILQQSPQNSLSAQDIQGQTVLHYIVQYNDIVLLEYLIKNHRALVQKALLIKNKELESPRDLAEKLNRTALIAIFKQL